jgi:hypothetical protein
VGTEDNRRSAPRQPIRLDVRYRVEEYAEKGWLACRVLDLSAGGACLGMTGFAPSVGCRVWIELLQEVSPFEGLVRNTQTIGKAKARVGIAFANLTIHQDRILADLMERARTVTNPWQD